MTKKVVTKKQGSYTINFEGVVIITDETALRKKIEKNKQIFPCGLDVVLVSEKITEIYSSLQEGYKIVIICSRHSKNKELLQTEKKGMQHDGYNVVMFLHDDQDEWEKIKPRLIRTTANLL